MGDIVKFEVCVSKIVEVTFDRSNFDLDFWKDFNSTITDRGGPDIEYLAEHAAWNFVQGYEKFIEGIGDLKEMGVQIREIDGQAELLNEGSLL